jgi:hypothetical protein
MQYQQRYLELSIQAASQDEQIRAEAKEALRQLEEDFMRDMAAYNEELDNS